MAGTSGTGNDAKPLKTDRRVQIDGGIDARSSPLAIQPGSATALGNFRFRKGGALWKRQGGTQQCTVPAYASVSSMAAPVLQDGGAASGTLASGTYTVCYVYGSVSNPLYQGGIIGPSPTAVITVAANHSIQILIPCINSGEGFGYLFSSNYADDPQNGGFLLSGINFGVFVKKTGDPNFTLQNVFDQGNTPSSGNVFNAHQFAMLAYINTGVLAPSATVAPVPIRFLFWHATIDTLIGLVGETPFAVQPNLINGPSYLALATDSQGRTFGFSRLPNPVTGTVVDRCLILSDAVGRPKILNSPADSSQQYGVSIPTSWSFRQLGAAAPAAGPSSPSKTGGVLTGTYFYLFTYVYQRNRQDGTFFLSESNSSQALGPVVLSSQQATINITAPAESGIVSWNLYRTVAGGTQFFLLTTTAIATLGINDNIPDAQLLGQQPPDKGINVPNDIPPQGLAMVTEHYGIGFGVVSNVLRKAGGGSAFNEMIRTRATNFLRYSKARFINDLVGLGGNINTLPGDFGNIDAWPSTYLFPCGNASPVTALISFRSLLYVFKEDAIGVVSGTTPQSFAHNTIWIGTGAMQGSVIQVGNYLLAFDQAMGPIMVSGYTVTDLGYNTIQQDWILPVNVIGAGEAATGGGRGGVGIVSAIWDPVTSEARWVVSNFQTDPTQLYAQGQTAIFYEYVCQVVNGQPSGQFTRFTGATIEASGNYTANSSSAQTVAVGGTYNFTVQSGLSYVFGDPVVGFNASNFGNFFFGYVQGYVGTTLTITVTALTGSGTIASFIILLLNPITDRRILSQDKCIVNSASVPFRPRDVVYGDYHGRLVWDGQQEYDLNGIATAPISMRATFPFFFGDDPEMVKQYRYLYMMTVTGSNAADGIVVQTESLSLDSTSPQTLTTIPGGQTPAGVNKLLHIPLTGSLDGTNSKDRGMAIVLSGVAQSGPTIIEEVTVKYQDDNYRSKP